MAGQTLNDRLIAARYILVGQSLARIVCKATTEEAIGPKRKHLDYLLQCTSEPNVSMPELANLLFERTQHSSWVVVFKSLITVHHLMCYGNEKFTQCLATSSCTFNLGSFVDKSCSQGYDMSTFVRRYSKYLNAKTASYRSVGFDFCKAKRGREEGVFKNMSTETLLKTLLVLQEQSDSLLDFDCNPDDLSNGVMNSCFMLLYRDLIQLFAAYNNGIINLFEKYYTMNKKNCREALDIYKKFIIIMDKVSEFLKVAERVGIDKGSVPDLTKAPSSLLEEMENHLAFLEKKGGHTGASTSGKNTSMQNAVTAFSSTCDAFSSSITNSYEVNGLTVDESVRRAVEEEAAIMSQLKSDGDKSLKWDVPDWQSVERRMRELATQPSGDLYSLPKISQPVAPSLNVPSALPPPGAVTTSSPGTSTKATPPSTSRASDDLLLLNNPFADSSFSETTNKPLEQKSILQRTNNSESAASAFVSESNFAAVFSTPANTGVFDAFGEILQPESNTEQIKVEPQVTSQSTTKILSTDLDSSLATLVENLDINGPKQSVHTYQWGSPKTPVKTGGANWTPISTVANPAGWGVPVSYMSGGMGASQWTAAMVGSAPYVYPGSISAMNQQPFVVGVPWQAHGAIPGVVPQPMQQLPTGAAVGGVVHQENSTIKSGTSSKQSVKSTNDPFGAL